VKIKKYNYVAIIPARKGSKRLKNKNLKKINKKNLLSYTLTAALKSKKISKIVISTDINKYLNYKHNKIITIKRPKYLAGDECSTELVMLHAINYLEKEKKKIINFILLQPTSPFRDYEDINKAILKFEKKKYDSLLSAYEEKLCLWKKNNKIFIPKNYNINSYKKIGGQFQPLEIIENGAIYIFKIKKFKSTKNRLFGRIGIFVMSKVKSLEIDDIEDLKLARLIAKT
jgi:N-acylneuraminate cytidylyltransferase